MNRRHSFCSILLGALFLAVRVGWAAPPDFLRDVRPILSGHCFKCHGPDEKARKAKLRLDLREEAVQPAKSGAPAIVPGKPADSELIRRIASTDEDEVMPPPSTKNPLSASQKEILRNWVAAGAEYKPHWAFAPPKQPPLPQIRQTGWPRNAIDFFILARMESEGLRPSPQADRYSLARRLYLDLIGLPPTPEEADEFVRDLSSDAYEKWVDRLLSSPPYGERWARRWLDLARYADTNGYEKDRRRSIWPYRDWVINAVNADLPFDQFTLEQIAGDMLPGATVPQRIATGFHRNTMLNEEGGIDPLEFRFYAMVDRANTTATTWLGLTLACAQCHTHKYDPITQREYYQFMAFLNNADEPEIDLASQEVAARRAELERKIAELNAALPDRFPLEEIRWHLASNSDFSSESKVEAEKLDDGSWRLSGPGAERDTYRVTFNSELTNVTHLRLEALVDWASPGTGPGRSELGNFVLSEITAEVAVRAASEPPQRVKLVEARADFSQRDFPVAYAIDGKTNTGWGIQGARRWHVNRTATFKIEKPVTFSEGARWTIELSQQHGKTNTLGRFRLSLGEPIGDPRPAEVRRHEHLEKKFGEWLQRESARVAQWTLLRPIEAKSNLPLLTIQPDNSVFASGDQSKRDEYELKFANGLTGITALRLEVLPDERLPKHGPGRVFYEGPAGDFFLSEFKVTANSKPVAIQRATHSYAADKSGAPAAIDGDPQSGWAINGGQGETHHAVFNLAEPLADPSTLGVKLLFERYHAAGLGRFKVWATTDARPTEASAVPDEIQALLLLPSPEPDGRASLSPGSRVGRVPGTSSGSPGRTRPTEFMGRESGDRTKEASPAPGRAALPRSRSSVDAASPARTPEQRQQLLEYFLAVAPELSEAHQEIEKLREQMPAFPTTLVMAERPVANLRLTHVHNRGEFLQPTERVEPGVLSVLHDLPANAARNRLAFARWLVSPDNPLVGRVTMNRQWAAFFGRGLVRTLQDFGFQGELPTHPELLDWLAVEFVQQGWSMKAMHKLIVMSATYRQSSRMTPELLEKDPQNKWLARGPRVRLEAELIRDSILSAGGLLSPKLGGPSVFPPQPPGVTTEGAYGALAWTASPGEDRYRRGLYTFSKRTAPYAMFSTFDAPSGEACVARREVSNSPLQSLTLLNDAVFFEAAQALGRIVASQHGDEEGRAAFLFRRCLTRPPANPELAMTAKFYREQKARFIEKELDPDAVAGPGEGNTIERAAWTAVARALLNLDEAISKP